MKNICKKTLVISIILLFVGVSLSSGISIDTKSVISQDKSEEDCGCEAKSDSGICKILEVFSISLELRGYSLLILYNLFERIQVFRQLLDIWFETLYFRLGVYVLLSLVFDCGWIPEPPH